MSVSNSGTLAPAGGFASPACLLKNLFAAPLASLELQLQAVFTADKAVLCSSGKEALYLLFSLLSRHTDNHVAAMSAYTCPDIAAAALRAGWSVLPLEIERNTLDIDVSAGLPVQPGAVVLSNLYGLPDDLARWESRGSGIIFVDDACQAAASVDKGRRVGGRTKFGILSFGRGKALCGIGGGAVLCFTGAEGKTPSGSSGKQPGVLGEGKDLMRSVLYWLFENPVLYTLPASLPLLGLGETNVKKTFRLAPLSNVEAAHALEQLKGEAHERCKERTYSWLQSLSDSGIIQPFKERGFGVDSAVFPIRYPVIFPSSTLRARAFAQFKAEGLGAALSYPKTLRGFAELKEGLLNNETPNAEFAASAVMTLPVHRHVEQRHVDRGAEIIRRVIKEGE